MSIGARTVRAGRERLTVHVVKIRATPRMIAWIELGQPLGREHDGGAEGHDQRNDEPEVAFPDAGLRGRALIDVVGPSQGPHRHAETLDREPSGDNLFPAEIDDAFVAQRVKYRHVDHASAGAGGVGDDRAKDPN
jgi:hypothetical protein